MDSVRYLTLAFVLSFLLLLSGEIPPAEEDSLLFAGLQLQSTSFDLRREDLKQAYWLSIRASSGTRLRGRIQLNGRVIQTLNGSSTIVNLAPYLRLGRQEVAIKGNYTPPEATVLLELKNDRTQIRQQSSGDGSLNQILMINVR
jgi:hypothetical protein